MIITPDTPQVRYNWCPVTRIDKKNYEKVTKGDSLSTRETEMFQTLADDSEVMFGQQEEIAGAMEMEGSSQNRHGRETWLEATEPYRGARTRTREFDRPVEGELGAISGDVEDDDISPAAVLEETVGHMQRDLEELQSENRFLITPGAVRPGPLVRQAALTTTKVPWFNGSTSWEQYLQGI